jgi:hypothetical protein
MNKSTCSFELEVDTSKFETILKELCPCFPDDISFSDLVRLVKLGFELDATAAPRANGTQRAVFEPLDFLLELLPAVRAGKLTFGAFEGILETKSRIWNESDHDK